MGLKKAAVFSVTQSGACLPPRQPGELTFDPGAERRVIGPQRAGVVPRGARTVDDGRDLGVVVRGEGARVCRPVNSALLCRAPAGRPPTVHHEDVGHNRDDEVGEVRQQNGGRVPQPILAAQRQRDAVKLSRGCVVGASKNVDGGRTEQRAGAREDLHSHPAVLPKRALSERPAPATHEALGLRTDRWRWTALPAARCAAPA
jgi:hypothetical protein